MKCLVTGCNHSKSNRMNHTKGTCWDEYQICPCCYYELFPIIESSAISPPLPVLTTRCNNLIKKELEKKPEPDYAQILKIKKKKKQKAREYLEKMGF